MANQSAKKRVEDNGRRLSVLLYIILGSSSLHCAVKLMLWSSSATRSTYVAAIGSIAVQLAIFASLRSMASTSDTRSSHIVHVSLTTAPTYSMTGELLDGGVDLKMKGTCEYLQDVVYLVALSQFLSLASSWAWCAFGHE